MTEINENKKPKHKLTIDINDDTYEYLKTKASDEGISMGKLIEKIVSKQDKDKSLDEIINEKIDKIIHKEREKTHEITKQIISESTKGFVTKGDLNKVIDNINELLVEDKIPEIKTISVEKSNIDNTNISLDLNDLRSELKNTKNIDLFKNTSL